MENNIQWTTETYAAHNEALRTAEKEFWNERDRRYAEVKAAEEKAIYVKEQADLRAMELERQVRSYKDEAANELRSQIDRERGLYVQHKDLNAAMDKIELMIKPLTTISSERTGKSAGLNAGWAYLVGGVGLIVLIVELIMRLK